MSSLYELTGDLLRLWEMADEQDVDEQVFFDTLEGVQGEFEDKADAYAKVIKSLNAEVDGIKAEMERLEKRKKAIENNSERIKKALESAMISTGNIKFKTTLFSFGIQKNPASVDVINEDDIPEKYWIPQPMKLDKKSILADIKAGNTVSGCDIKQTEGLRIR